MKSGRHFHITGIVQGVGFRPFVYRLAMEEKLTGEVFNTADGVIINAFGEVEALDSLSQKLTLDPPPLAQIDQVSQAEIEWETRSSFVIINSRENPDVFMPISPDIAICEDCRREILNPGNRRHHYAFTNCTNCGPRFSIIEKIPYDRPKTSMKGFPLCENCAREYQDPLDRRFHAQPVACEECGPKLSIFGTDICGEAALTETVKALRTGEVAAIKGIGGFHLACDARNENALDILRERKKRTGKAFALMARDIETVEKYCLLNAKERELLCSPAAPIVLLKKRTDGQRLPESIAPGQNDLGFMLPYTPLHVLLFEALSPEIAVLVMTSANFSEEPIVYKDEDIARLSALADVVLTHDRPILTRIDDSVVKLVQINGMGKQAMIPIRRARGYAPQPIRLASPMKQILGCGAELKNTFCLTREEYAFVSQHIGDMENIETYEAFEKGLEHYQELFRVKPTVIACDLHPNYLTTAYAKKRAERDGLPLAQVQHHYAHIASVMTENRRFNSKPLIGLAFDGTGYGTDGTIWGGEFLICNSEGFERAFHLDTFPIAGGDISIHKPARLALSLLFANGLEWQDRNPATQALSETEKQVLKAQLVSGINCTATSSMGRLFDAVSAMIGIRQVISYEGQAAIELENAADANETQAYHFAVCADCLQVRPLLDELLADISMGVSTSIIAARFHNGLINACVEICDKIRERSTIRDVALSGGVWQNQFLRDGVIGQLSQKDFNIYLPQSLPFNDGGLSLGQVAVANKLCGKEV